MVFFVIVSFGLDCLALTKKLHLDRKKDNRKDENERIFLQQTSKRERESWIFLLLLKTKSDLAVGGNSPE